MRKILIAANTGLLGVASSIARVIAGDGQFTKSTSDTLILLGINAYTGGSIVSAVNQIRSLLFVCYLFWLLYSIK